jgi:hypothetical protein
MSRSSESGYTVLPVARCGTRMLPPGAHCTRRPACSVLPPDAAQLAEQRGVLTDLTDRRRCSRNVGVERP